MAEAGDEAGTERPLVLVGGRGGAARVRAANEAALGAGIRPGVHTAARARSRAADLLVRPWDDALLDQAQEELAARLLRHSPAVTSAGLGCFWLDATGQERLGGDAALAARLLLALREAGHPDARVGLAASVVAAQAAVSVLETGMRPACSEAAGHLADAEAGRPLAGSEAGRPLAGPTPSFLVVPPDPRPKPGHGVDARFLAPLPLALLPLPHDLQEVLTDLGLQTVGELAALPAPSLELRFGSAGLRSIALARGLDPRGPLCQGGPRTRALEVLLDPPAELLDPLAFAARGALVTLLRALAQEGTRITKLRLHLRLDDEARPIRRDVGLARPSARLVTLTDRCRAALSTLTLPAPVLALTVEILERAPGLGGEQGDLFEARFRDPEALETALCRIRARCGTQSVVRPVLVDEHRPEAAGRWQADPPLGDEEALPEPPPVRAPPPGPSATPAPMPPPGPTATPAPTPPPEVNKARESSEAGEASTSLWRALRTPEPPPVVEVRLEPDGRPRAVRLGRRWHTITETSPLARRSGQWWRDEAWSRQDHLVTTEGGARLLLSLQADGRWRLLAWED